MKDTTSFWETITTKSAHYPTLTEDLEVDVSIIGGGITGITAALHLINAGKKVAILEADEIGGVTTGYSTGNLYVAVQPYYQKLESKFNFETAKQIAQSRQFAIDYIEKNVIDKKINCQFSRRPWYIYADDNQISFLEKEVELFKKMDFPIDYVDALPLPLKFKKAAVLSNQARFNPLQYVVDLAQYLQKQGCLIFEKSRVISIEEKDNKCFLQTDKAKVIANHNIVATHTPIGINTVQMFTAPYRSYVVAVSVKDGIYPEGHFWDLKEPHHAICTHSISGDKPEILMVAGNHHKVGQTDDAASHFSQLEKFLRDHFQVQDVLYQWSAQHYHAADGVPYIGLASRGAKNSYIATGFYLMRN